VASEVRVGRALVVVAGVLGLFFFVQALVTDNALFRSFINGAVAAFAVMVLGGVGRRLWRGAEVAGAQAPGGWGLNFFAKATLRPIQALEERINRQMDALNVRLLGVEEQVAAFKGSTREPENKE
jgi:hypothetical protein